MMVQDRFIVKMNKDKYENVVYNLFLSQLIFKK